MVVREVEADHQALTDLRLWQEDRVEGEVTGPDHGHQDVISEVAAEAEEEADVVVEEEVEMIMVDFARSVQIQGQDLGPRDVAAQDRTRRARGHVRLPGPPREGQVEVVVAEGGTLHLGGDVAVRIEVVVVVAGGVLATIRIAIVAVVGTVGGGEGTGGRWFNFVYIWHHTSSSCESIEFL